MGLAICRSIVDAHHGRLWAVRTENRSGILFHASAQARRHEPRAYRLKPCIPVVASLSPEVGRAFVRECDCPDSLDRLDPVFDRVKTPEALSLSV